METAVNSTTFSELIQGDKPVLADFYTEWCDPCKIMSLNLKELKSMVGDRVTIITIDAEKNPRAAAKYQVRGVPTLILFQNGQIKWRKSGVVQTSQLKSIFLEQINSQ